MQCPVCKEVVLVMSDRQGIEVDYCPQCRGVWLDRGELDKIIERATPDKASLENRTSYSHDRGERNPREHDDDYPHRDPRRKKKGFLSEIFDFD